MFIRIFNDAGSCRLSSTVFVRINTILRLFRSCLSSIFKHFIRRHTDTNNPYHLKEVESFSFFFLSWMCSRIYKLRVYFNESKI